MYLSSNFLSSSFCPWKKGHGPRVIFLQIQYYINLFYLKKDAISKEMSHMPVHYEEMAHYKL
jgi:hypothetical protein